MSFRLLDLPCELLQEVLYFLDYKDLSRLSQTSRRVYWVIEDDNLLWRSLYRSSFSASPTESLNARSDLRARIVALREFIIRGSNAYHAPTVRTIIAENNATTLRSFLDRSFLKSYNITLQHRGFSITATQKAAITTAEMELTAQFVKNPDLDPDTLDNDKLVDMTMTPTGDEDAGPEVYLCRLLLARQLPHPSRIDDHMAFLLSAHLVVYGSTRYPLFHSAPHYEPVTRSRRYDLRSSTSTSGSTSHAMTDQEGTFINWGVIETIHLLVKLYLNRLPHSIPRFDPVRDEYESQVPMSACMFDAGIEGNWKGLYGYMDFRELETLDDLSSFAPDYFDGIQNIKICAEEDCDEDDSDDEDDPFDLRSTWTNSSLAGCKKRFRADGMSAHGPFHIHGSTRSISGYQAGFKLVTFDRMANEDGEMPWIMLGIYVPSIGIVGRWGDRTEPRGEGVEGPYVLWRDRIQDVGDQEDRMEAEMKQIESGEECERTKVLPVKHLHNGLPYIVIEEMSKKD